MANSSFHDAGYGFDTFGFYPPLLTTMARVAAPLYEHYFRVDSVGAEQVPSDGPAILIANHAGALPADAAILCLDVLRRTPRTPRAVTDHFVPRLPFVSTWLARMGVVSGTRTNVRQLLETGELIAIWPEGVSGPAKPFRDRYRIQAWRVGFAELAIRYRAPVIPVAIIGAEESWPVVARLRVHALGVPYVPVPAVPVPLPARFHLRYGAPIDLARGHSPDAADDPAVVRAAAGEARDRLEELISTALKARQGVFR